MNLHGLFWLLPYGVPAMSNFHLRSDHPEYFAARVNGRLRGATVREIDAAADIFSHVVS
jgi:hypothetical protein